jgi:hypothetical protein
MFGADLGSLVVKITTDLTNFNTGMKAAEERIRNTTGKITDYTNKIGTTMTVMGAAVTGMYGVMIKASADYADQLYEVNQRTGVAIETLSMLKYVADQTESSFEAVSQAMKFLNRNIYEATQGNYQANKGFQALGITLKNEVTGEVLKAEEVFFRVADAFQKIDNASTKTALAMQIFGRQGEAIIPILNLGSDEIKRLSLEAQRLGLVLTGDNAKSLDRFSDGMKTLKAAIGGLWLNISLLLVPALENLVRKITSTVVALREWSEAHPKLSTAVSGLTLSIGALMVVLGPLLIAFNQIVKAIGNIRVALPLLIALFGKLKIVLASLAPVIAAVVVAFSAWKLGEWLESNTEKIKKFWDTVYAFTHPFKPKGPVMEFGWGGTEETPAAATPETEAPVAEKLDLVINKIEQHVQKLKELNEEYLSGRISAEEYYTGIHKLQEDGIDQKQKEMELILQSNELEKIANDISYQRLSVLQESIQAAEDFYRTRAELANQDLIDQQNTLNSATQLLQTLQGMHKTAWQGIFDFVNTGIQKFSSGFASAISNIATGAQNASEAFKQLGTSMIASIIEFVVQYGVQALIAITIGKMISRFVSGIAGEIASAWLPAATFASIATLGAAAAEGTVALGGAMGVSMGMFSAMKAASHSFGAVPLAEGGIVTRPTLALIGEKGPEAVVPLEKESGMGNTINLNFYDTKVSSEIDINILAEQLGYQIEERLHAGRKI